jgi:uncharacterized membrane protein HdeD (DUF308 family)
MKDNGPFSKVVKVIGAVASVLIGCVLLLSSSDSVMAESLFIGVIALACGAFVWNGASPKQGKIIACVLLLLALYAFAKAFELFDTTIIRRLAGVFAIASGLILLTPIIASATKNKNVKTTVDINNK